MKELEDYPTVETLETDQLVDLKTKVSLATFVKLSEITARKRWKRGIIVENALSDYLDMQIYCLDKAELAEYKKLLKERADLHPNTLERMEELKKRIEKYERKYKIQYDHSNGEF